MSAARLPRPSIAIGRTGIIVLGATLVVLATAARFASGLLDRLDEAAADPFDAPSHLGFFRDVSELGSTGLTIALGIAVSLAVWRRCRPLAILYPAAVLGGAVVNVVLKTAIGRARPPGALTDTALASFPSGHTIQATIALGMLPPVIYALTASRAGAIAATVAAAVAIAGVGFSRVVLNAHWATDIVGGIIVGILVLLAAEFVLDRAPSRWVPSCAHCPLHRTVGLAHRV